MDSICLATQLAAHISIFISIMLRYNQLTKLKNRYLSLLAALLAGVSLAASIRIVLTWPEPITLIDYAESLIISLSALYVIHCRGSMTRILKLDSLKPAP